MAKHTTAEWFDMYKEIVLNQVNDMVKGHKSGEKPLPGGIDEEAITEHRKNFESSLEKVKRDFVAQGLSLTERVDFIGPTLVNDQFGVPQPQWGFGEQPWIRFMWPDGGSLMFTGDEAFTSCNFFAWWVQYQNVELRNEPGKVRSVERGSRDWLNYVKMKKGENN